MSVHNGKDAWQEVPWQESLCYSLPSPPIPPPPPEFSSILAGNIQLKTTPTLIPTLTNVSLVPVVIVDSVDDDNPPGLDTSSSSGSDSEDDHPGPSPISKNIQEKIDVFDQSSSSKFYRKKSESEKRKASDDSPDKQDLTKAEKRSLKKEKKKLRKLEYQRADLLKTC